jgi:hypothetical protein
MKKKQDLFRKNCTCLPDVGIRPQALVFGGLECSTIAYPSWQEVLVAYRHRSLDRCLQAIRHNKSNVDRIKLAGGNKWSSVDRPGKRQVRKVTSVSFRLFPFVCLSS